MNSYQSSIRKLVLSKMQERERETMQLRAPETPLEHLVTPLRKTKRDMGAFRWDGVYRNELDVPPGVPLPSTAVHVTGARSSPASGLTAAEVIFQTVWAYATISLQPPHELQRQRIMNELDFLKEFVGDKKFEEYCHG